MTVPEDFWAAILRKDSDADAPANTMAFLDVSEASIGSGGFGIDWIDWKSGPFNWYHQPGERHGRGANLSFVDGHVEGHRWLFTPKRFVSDVSATYNSPVANGLDRQDLMWIVDRTHLGQYRKRVLGLPKTSQGH